MFYVGCFPPLPFGERAEVRGRFVPGSHSRWVYRFTGAVATYETVLEVNGILSGFA
jgi:2-keto-3-deoxy-galactonokinase